jgi:hypothetical protein
MTPRRKLLILAIGLAFIVPLAVGVFSGYLNSLDRPQRNWYWDAELVGSQLIKDFPEPVDYFTRPTMEFYDTSFRFYWQSDYSRTLKSVDGGPITIQGDDNPFSPSEPAVRASNPFTFGDVYDNLAWFVTDWQPLQWLGEQASFLDPMGFAAAAHAGNSYLTLDDTNCVAAAASTDADCWDDTSGEENDGDGSGFIPDGTDTVYFDANSGIGPGTMDGNLVFDSLDTTGFPGTFAISTFELDVDNNIVHAAGTITIGASAALGLDVGGSLTLSGTAAITMGASAADADIDGLVNISAATAYIDFGSGAWTVGGTWTNATTAVGWDDGTGTMTFDGDTGTMTFAGTNLSEPEFYDVTFTSANGAAQIFTMATRGLWLGDDLIVADGGAGNTTELDTAGLALTIAGEMIITNDGIVDAGASAISVGSNWTAGAARADFQADTSTVTMTASASVLVTGTGDFYNLIVSGGTVTFDTAVDVTNDVTISGGILAKAAQTLGIANDLLMSGGDFTSTSGNVTIGGLVNISNAASAIDFGSETWTVSGTWTNASTDDTVWDAGTGTMLFDSATGGTMTFAGANLSGENEFWHVSFISTGEEQVFTMATRALQIGGDFVLGGGDNVTEFDTASLDVTIGGSITLTGSTFSVGTSTITVGGDWTSNQFKGGMGASTVDFTANATITLNAAADDFFNLTISGGTATVAANFDVLGAMIISGGTFAKATYTLDVTGSLTMSGGDFTSTSGDVTIGGLVNISNAASAIDFGSETWTVSGVWTNASTDAAWDAGTGTMLFDSATATADGSSTFMGANLDEPEFYNLTFTSSAGSDQIFTMVTRGLRVLNTLSIVDGSFTTTLATADLAIGHADDDLDLSVGDNGILTANASTVLAGTVTMTGGASGIITVTSGAWTVSGNWDTSGVGSTYTQGTGVVTFDAAASITMLATDLVFDDLTITGGTVTMATAVTVSNALTLTDEFATADFTLILGSLVVGTAGILTANASTVSVNTVDMTGGVSGVITVTTGDWTVSGSWDTSGAGSTYTQGTGAVDIDAAGSIDMLAGQQFDELTISGGPVAMASDVVVVTSLTLTAELQTTDFALTAAGLVVGTAGILTANAAVVDLASVTMTGGVSGTITVTTGLWTVSGNWNTSGAGSTWTEGTGGVTIDAAATITMLAGDITFDDLTISGGPVVMAQAVSVTDALVLTAELQTGDFTLTAAGLTVGTAGVLTANASTVDLTTVTMTGGVSGVITVTSGAWTVSGNWNTSGAGSTFTEGTGSVIIDANATINLLGSDDDFYDLDINGTTVTMATAITVNDLTVTGGTLATGDFALTAAGLVVGNAGILTANASTVDLVSVLMAGGASGTITVTTGVWTVSGSWNTSGVGSTYTQGTGSVTFDAVATITMLATDIVFDDLLITGGPVLMASAVTVSNDLTLTAEFQTADLALILGGLIVNTAGVLTANASVVSMATVTMTGGVSGVITVTTGAWTVSGAWDTSGAGSTYTQGTGIVTFDAIATITMLGTDIVFDDLTIAGAGTVTMASAVTVTNTLTLTDELATADFALIATALVVNNLGQLTANASVVDLATVTMTGGASGAIVVTTGVWTVSGNWNTSGAGSTYTQGTGSVTFDAVATITLLGADNVFDDLVITPGGGVVVTLATNMVVTNALTITTGTFAKATFTVGAGSLTMDGGDLTSTSGNVTITGAVNISAAASAITFGTEDWTVSGTWTNTSTDGGVWDSGTGTVTFDSATGGAMVFAPAGLGEPEFNDVTFSSSGGASQTFTMGTNGLQWEVGSTLTITDAAGGTILDKATFTLDGGDLTLAGAAGGNLVSTSGDVTVGAVNVQTAASYIILGSEAWTVTDTWVNLSTVATWDAGSGTVSFTSVTGATLDWAVFAVEEDEFNNVLFASSAAGVQTFVFGTNPLIAGGTMTINSITTVNTDAAVDLDLTAGALSMDATAILITNGSDVDINGAVTLTDVNSYITSDGDGTWAVSGAWTSASTDAGWAFAAPITFDGAGAGQAIGGAGTNNVFAAVVLNGTAKSFTANITTAGLTSGDAAKTLTITDTITWTVTGGSAIAGGGAGDLTIVSSTPGTQWTWTSAGAVTITFANITDAAADAVAAATAADFDATAANNTDGENNTYVEFAGSPVTEYLAVRWYEDADSYYWAATVSAAVALTQFDIATDLGYQGTTVDVFGPAGISTWTACNSVVGAAVTFTLGGLANDAAYWLRQDGVNEMVAATDGTGVGSWTTTGSWDVACATNAMALGPIGGGGGAPTDPPEVEDPDIFTEAATWVESVMPIIAYAAFALAGALGIAFFLHRKITTALWAILATLGGVGMWLASAGAESFMAGFQTVLVVATAGLWVGFGLIRSPRMLIYAAIMTAITVFVFLNPF